MGAALQRSAARSGIWDEHEAICRAIAEGDADRAAAMSERHADEARRNLMRNLRVTLAKREEEASSTV